MVTVGELAAEMGKPSEEIERILRDLDLGGNIETSGADGGRIIRAGINYHGRVQLEEWKRKEVWLLRNAILGWFAERYYSDPHDIYSTEDAEKDLGIPANTLIPHVRYLDEKGYLECFWNLNSEHTSGRITSAGLDVWENPNVAKQEGFIRIENAVVAGNISQAAIQIGTQQSVQVVGDIKTDIDVEATKEAIKQIRNLLTDHQVDAAVYEDIEAQLQTAEAQMKSPRPKTEWVSEALKRAADLIQVALGTALGEAARKIIDQLLR